MSGETRPVRILRALAAAPDVLSTSQIVDELAEGIEPRQKALAWYGSILRRQAQTGVVEKSGKVRSQRYHGAPTITWRITEEGEKLLAYIGDAPRRRAEEERLTAEMAAAVQARTEALSEAARLCSRETPRADRWATALRLRSLGCTLGEIGDLFGVSPEMIRQDLLLPEPPAPARPGPRPRPNRISGPRFAGATVVMPDSVLMLRIGKRKVYLTRDEARQLAEVIQAWEAA